FEDFLANLLEGPARELLDLVRETLLAPDARILPQRARLHAAPLCAESQRAFLLPPALVGPRSDGLDFGPIVELQMNDMHQAQIDDASGFLAPPLTMMDHSFAESLPRNWSFEGSFSLDTAGPLDGVCFWFDLQIDDEVVYSNAPGQPAIWGQMLLLTPARWVARKGDRLAFSLRFDGHADRGFWGWSFALGPEGGEARERHQANTFASLPLASATLGHYQPEETVRLNLRARELALVLSLADGQRSAADIAEELVRRTDLDDPDEALRRVFQHLEILRAP
ncbi:MAG: hypothetical protein JRH01_21795, partial [Deltaproteobacteria bacterium]|nr:hypothetical protein [Deltaproteobacteria bacterium]